MKQIIFIISVFLITAQPAQAEIVGFWNFNDMSTTSCFGTVLDSSGKGNDAGKLCPVAIDGVYGIGLSFPHPTAYETGAWVPSSNSLPFPSELKLPNALTLMAWVRVDSNQYGAFIERGLFGNPAVYYNYSLEVSDDGTQRFLFRLSNGPSSSQTSIFFSSSAPQASEWTHVAATYDGAIVKFYINGVFDSKFNFQGPLETECAPSFCENRLNIGTGFGGANGGHLDEVQIYNSALSESEIIAAMNNDTSSPNPPTANAGKDKFADANQSIVLDGSMSTDDGQLLYRWTRLPDNIVVCNFSLSPTCTTKILGRAEEVIELSVIDSSGNIDTDTVRIVSRLFRKPMAIALN